MKSRSVPISEIKAHPNMSLSPADYLNDLAVFKSMFAPLMKEAPPEEGDLAVWRTVNPPGKPRWFAVPDVLTGAFFIQALSIADLGNSGIHSNVMGLCRFEDDEWTDWYDDDGNDIEEYIKAVGEFQRVQLNRRSEDERGK